MSSEQPERSEVRGLLRLAIPLIVAQFGQMLLGAVDAIFAGRLSVHALDAVALGNIWLAGTIVPALGIVLGLDPLVSQAHGAGRGDEVALGLQRALLIAVVLSVFVALSWTYTEEVLLLLGQEPELSHEAATYMHVQRFSAPAFLIYGALSTYLVSRGIARPGIVVMVIANVFNVCAVRVLAFGGLGIAPLGVRGLGLATGLTRALLPLALLGIIAAYDLHVGAWQPWSRRVLSLAPLRRQLALGVPSGVTLALELWAFQFGTVLAGRLGASALGAHAIALNLASLSFTIPLGFSIGASARVGQLLGQGQPSRADRAARTALVLTAAWGLFAGLTFTVGRTWLPAFYTEDAAIIAAAAAVLPIAGAFQLLDSLQAAGSGILRGMGRPRVTATTGLFGYMAVAIPFAYYTSLHTSLGLAGVWLGYALGLGLVAATLVTFVLLRGPRTAKAL